MESRVAVGIVALVNVRNESMLKKLKHRERLTVSTSTITAAIITFKQSVNQQSIEGRS
jgi:hypothetical protein